MKMKLKNVGPEGSGPQGSEEETTTVSKAKGIASLALENPNICFSAKKELARRVKDNAVIYILCIFYILRISSIIIYIIYII